MTLTNTGTNSDVRDGRPAVGRHVVSRSDLQLLRELAFSGQFPKNFADIRRLEVANEWNVEHLAFPVHHRLSDSNGYFLAIHGDLDRSILVRRETAQLLGKHW